MKIALLTSVAGNGGSAATAFRMARLLTHLGHKVEFFAPGDYWPERGQAEGVSVRTFLELRRGFHPLSFWRDYRAFRHFLRDEGADAVLVQKSPEQWLALLVLLLVQRPVALVRWRGVVFPVRPNFLNSWLHNTMDLVLCSASVIAAQYRNLPNFNRSSVKVLFEGVDTARFAPPTPEERAAARARFQLDPRALLIGTAGRPAPVKGHDVLVRAFAQACDAARTSSGETLHPRLCIFADESRRGPGSYTNLESLCRELKIAGLVDLRPGFIADMRTVYQALDLFVLPSRGSEGSSRAALEACACGLPFIASEVGVLPDLVVDGQTGRLVPPDDPAALAACLRETLQAWPRAREWGEAARARMVKQFREEEFGEKLAVRLAETVVQVQERGG